MDRAIVEASAREEGQALSFSLPVFEGPLDLLLRLIAKNKVSIYDIPIAQILDEYLAAVAQMRRLDMEVAGEFVTMAAELMRIKSRMLLPRTAPDDEPEEDPRAALSAALAAYQKAKEDAAMLAARYAVYGGRMGKEPMDTAQLTPEKPPLAPQQVEDLAAAFSRIAARRQLLQKTMTEEPAMTLDVIVRRKVTPIVERIGVVLKLLRARGTLDLEGVLTTCETRSELVASFVALLQLIREGRVRICEESGGDNPLLAFVRDDAVPDTADGGVAGKEGDALGEPEVPNEVAARKTKTIETPGNAVLPSGG